MTEVLVSRKHGDMPVAIVRPAIVGSSWKEPVPGWVDVISAAGAVFVSVGAGVVKFLPGSPETIADIVPVDYVANSVLCAAAHVYDQNSKLQVFHSATSSENPVSWGIQQEYVKGYFDVHPPPVRLGKPEFAFMSSPQEYQLNFFLRYSVPATLLNTLALVGTASQKKKAAQFSKLVFRVRVIIESFKHFVMNEWIFDNRNLRQLHHLMPPEDRELFSLDLAPMKWSDYLSTFAFGLLRYVFYEPLVAPAGVTARHYLEVAHPHYETAPKSRLARLKKRLLPDWTFVNKHYEMSPQFGSSTRSRDDTMELVLNAPEVRQAMADEVAGIAIPPREDGGIGGRKRRSGPPQAEEVEDRARGIIEKMFSDASMPVASGLGLFLRKVWKRLYTKMLIDAESLEKVRAAAAKGPIVFIPTHRSYVDFLVLSYVCFVAQLPLPYIAAGEDFLGILFVRWVFRKSGAFFIRRSFSNDALYTAIFNCYVRQLLIDGNSIEFFIEGTRSRSGKMLHPKIGLLSTITSALLDKQLEDVTVVPLAINYEKTIEGDLYSSELLGDRKIRESLASLLASRKILNVNFGCITVNFAEPLSVRQWTAEHLDAVNKAPPAARLPPVMMAPFGTPEEEQAEFAARIAERDARAAQLQPYDLSSSRDSNTAAASDDDESVGGGGFKLTSDRAHFNRMLAYRIVYDMARNIDCMPTHLVGTLMLMYRQGITKEQLVDKVEWLRKEILARGGWVANVELQHSVTLVEEAINHLGHLILQRTQNVFEPDITARSNYRNMLVLGHYRNKVVHHFYREGLFACALYSFGDKHGAPGSGGVLKSVLLREVQFLHNLLHREFIYKANPDEPEDFVSILDMMKVRGILTETHHDGDDFVEVAASGETHYSFLCAILWPYIDSYYAVALILFSLQPGRSADQHSLLQRTQWLAMTLYHESMSCFYEASSKETLGNAFDVFKKWGVIDITRGTSDGSIARKANKKHSSYSVSLRAPFTEERPLQILVKRIDRLRKQPPVRQNAVRRQLFAEIPILAKL